MAKNQMRRNRITELERTCDCYPAQWQGKDDDGNDIYIRYRHGCLRADVNDKIIFEKEINACIFDDQYMPNDFMKNELKYIFDFDLITEIKGFE